MTNLRAALATAAFLAVCPVAEAQTWRNLTSSRQLRGERELSVDVSYGAGRFSLGPGPSGTLYRMEMRYDEERFTPVRDYDTEGRRLRLGLRGRSGVRVNIGDRRSERPSSLDITVSPDVTMDLSMQLGAVESNVDLGGLSLRRVSIRTGASRTMLRFDSPNRVQCDLLEMEAGAAEFHAYSLGNANCARIRFRGGVGEVLLDLSGPWTRSATADIDVGVGSIALRLPSDAGVSIRLSRFLASFDSRGLERRGDTFYSENYDSARHRLQLDISAAIGSISVQWARP